MCNTCNSCSQPNYISCGNTYPACFTSPITSTFCTQVQACLPAQQFTISNGTQTDAVPLGSVLTFVSTDNAIDITIADNEVRFTIDCGTLGTLCGFSGGGGPTTTETQDLFNGFGLGQTVIFLVSLPAGSSIVKVFRNGLYQVAGVGNDYTRVGATITFLAPLLTTDQVAVVYNY